MATGFKTVRQDEAEEQVLQVTRELLRELGSRQATEGVSLSSSLDQDLGLGSLERVELLVRLEARFNTRLPEEMAQQAGTLADWVEALQDGHGHQPERKRYSIIQPSREAPPAPEDAETWVDVLDRHAQFDPGRAQVHLLEEDSGRDITYGELYETASRVAAGLASSGLRRDETVAIMLPTCDDFFFAFFGVMLAGGIPVPIYPPARPDKIEEYVRRQILILRNADVRFLISFDQVKAVTQIMRLNLPDLLGVATVATLAARGENAKWAAGRPSDIAFIQYTSGSTGDPKGVVLTQSNVLANVRGIGWSVNFRPTDIVVSWLPLYHDMGLIGSWLFSVYFGSPITVMSPLAFLRRPERWLWAMHDSGGTLCPAPNFSYELCARKIPDRALQGLDLSAWRVAINAGEAVLPDTLGRFADRFKPYGFRAEAFVPCYGLAESSVALTFPPMDRKPVIDVIQRDLFEGEGRAIAAKPGDMNVLRFVANGRPMPGHEVKLVDSQGQEVSERVQARLFFRGLSRTNGYYRNPQASAAVITQDGWMDSGDLAYWANGEIYVTGRQKDLIIKSGRNIIPQEVEEAAAEVPGVRKGCVAAFGTLDHASGTERLVVVAEARAIGTEEQRKMRAEVMKAVSAAIGIPPDDVVFVLPNSIPKTSSGKIRRNATRSLFESGKLHDGKRPPWLQITRLWFEHCGAWAKQIGERLARRLQIMAQAAWVGAVGIAGGTLTRIAPHASARCGVVRASARLLLWPVREPLPVVSGYPTKEKLPVIFLANRAGFLDPLMAAATLPGPWVLADGSVLRPLPPAIRFLLSSLVLPEVSAKKIPPGGTLQERMTQSLRAGQSVLVFADGPAGLSPARCRFRLEPFQSASQTLRPVIPVAIEGTQAMMKSLVERSARTYDWKYPEAAAPAHHAVQRGKARIAVGEAVWSSNPDHFEVIRFRQDCRERLAQLFDASEPIGR
ncbi:MAG TPA: AMP-binding protein [Terriglobia bacterium]|nr:AMP-binding protein [Terriglobia bacterium]